MRLPKKYFLKTGIVSIFSFFLLFAIFPLTIKAYEQVINETSPVDQLAIEVKNDGGIFWAAEIHNKDVELPIAIIWDRSSYLSTSGRSSRLVPKGNASVRPSAPQAPSKILAEQTEKILFTSEDLLPYAEKASAPNPNDPSLLGYISIALRKKGEVFFWRGSIKFINQEMAK